MLIMQEPDIPRSDQINITTNNYIVYLDSQVETRLQANKII